MLQGISEPPPPPVPVLCLIRRLSRFISNGHLFCPHNLSLEQWKKKRTHHGSSWRCSIFLLHSSTETTWPTRLVELSTAGGKSDIPSGWNKKVKKSLIFFVLFFAAGVSPCSTAPLLFVLLFFFLLPGNKLRTPPLPNSPPPTFVPPTCYSRTLSSGLTTSLKLFLITIQFLWTSKIVAFA